ncbi:hypothetical protein ABPG74_018931 [Tetrahymena malaccensis]
MINIFIVQFQILKFVVTIKNFKLAKKLIGQIYYIFITIIASAETDTIAAAISAEIPASTRYTTSSQFFYYKTQKFNLSKQRDDSQRSQKSNEEKIYNTVQSKAWTNSEVLLEWIEYFKKQIDNYNPFILKADSYGLHSNLLPTQYQMRNLNIREDLINGIVESLN